MELIKKQPAQGLDLIIKSSSKIIDYTRNGIIITNNSVTRNTTQNKQMSKTQTCFKLKVVNSPAMGRMFL